MFSLTIVLINILQISLQTTDQDKSGCSKNGCFPSFGEKNLNVKSRREQGRGLDRSELSLDPNISNPKMRELIKSEFLDFKEETLEDLEKFGAKKCSCGKYLLKEMQKIEYGDWHFRVWPEAIGKGATSNVFHAHAMSDLLDFDLKPLKLKKCVALKSMLLSKTGYMYENEMRNEMKILKKFSRINSKHIIRLYAFKDLSKSLPRQLLFLIELGEYNFREKLENMKEKMENIWQTNKKHSELIEKMIKNKFIEILEAVKEMHKLAIHLDLRPENMLYVKEGHKMTLKIIDFGGSELIPENSEINVKKRANVCKLRKTIWGNDVFSSPEQRTCYSKFSKRAEYEFSTKSDIWSVGVILLEMILSAPMFKHEIARVNRDEAIDLIYEMFKSGDDLIDIEKQKSPLREILEEIRDKFSKQFSNILKATVNKEPKERTTARGLLDFIANKCHLFKSNPHPFSEIEEYVEETISGQNSQQEMLLPQCDQETTGNPLALSDEVKSNESEVKSEENIIG